MFFKPDILALFISSWLICGMLLFSAFYAVQILKKWDIRSGSEVQLGLERKTYLISVIMAYALAFQLLSFFLFIYTADHLHQFFTGAMCAAGSLYANRWGYPVAILKTVNFLVAGLWLMVNYCDNRGYDYPLIKVKYTWLLALTPLVTAESILQSSYFLGLKPEVITSCCGALFTREAGGLVSEVIALPLKPMELVFFAGMAVTLGLGLVFYRIGKGAYALAVASFLVFLIAVASLLSFISIYIYELPSHHCPFCILQREYGYIGYPLYLTLLGGALTAMGVGVLSPFRNIASLKESLPPFLKRLALTSLIFYMLFTVCVVYQMMSSNLKL